MKDIVELSGDDSDYSILLDAIGDRRLVLLGEASHGSHEFYRERARLTKLLIEKLGFIAVAVEADWPDAYRVHRHVLGQSSDRRADDALGDFKRFPAWMWRNEDVERFVTWLKIRNDAHASHQSRVRFYGLDLYSLRTSMEAVVSYLEGAYPQVADAARQRYACFDSFDHFETAGPDYGYAVAVDVALPCEDEVVAELVELRRNASRILSSDGWVAEDEYFFAEQNARLVQAAEHYYRTMYQAGVSSWNQRDQHMYETLAALADHLDRQLGRARIVVWEHNSHVGDARATELGAGGELNVGQLAREHWPDDCFLVGFTTSHGWVTAASDWGGPAERKSVRPAPVGSFEERFHRTGPESFVAITDPLSSSGQGRMLERAIGVVYRPRTERQSHWFHADLEAQFDAVIHIDRTHAVVPLERTARWDTGEPPETYPTGL